MRNKIFRKNRSLNKAICICICAGLFLTDGCGSKDNGSAANTDKLTQEQNRKGINDDKDLEKQQSQGTGANDQEQPEQNPKAGNVIAFPEQIQKQLNEKIQVDASVYSKLDTSQPMYTYQSGYNILDDQKLQEIFFEEEEEVTKSADSDMQSYRCETTDGEKYASSNNMVVTFQRKKDSDYGKVLSFCTDSHRMYPDSFDTVEIPEQLSFMDGKEAKRIVREKAEKMEVMLAPEPYVFAPLDAAALKALQEEVYRQMCEEVSAKWADEVIQNYLPGIDFEGDKGCYYMLWQQQCPHGETIMSNNYVGDNKIPQNLGSYIMGIVNENGLATFHAFYTYDFAEETVITDRLAGVEEALQKIAELYETVPLTEEYCITDITFQYVAVAGGGASGKIRLVPAWCMETSEDNYRLFILDALNGVLL